MRNVVVVGRSYLSILLTLKHCFPQDFTYLSVAKRLLPVIGKEQKSSRTSQQRELVKKQVVKKKFVKSDKSLGSKKQKTVRGIFSNAARVVTYVKRII